MEWILGGLVLILSNYISFTTGKKFAPNAMALAAAQREWAYEKDQYEVRFNSMVREKNRVSLERDKLSREYMDLALEPATNPQLTLTDKIKGLAGQVERGF